MESCLSARGLGVWGPYGSVRLFAAHEGDYSLPVEAGTAETESSCSHGASELTRHYVFFDLIFTKVMLRSIGIPVLRLREPRQGQYLTAGSRKSWDLTRTFLVKEAMRSDEATGGRVREGSTSVGGGRCCCPRS